MTALTLDSDYMSKVGHAMGCISFADEDLDNSIKQIWPEVERALGGPDGVFAPSQEQARVAMAHALAFSAALKSIRDTSKLESLMQVVGFLDEADEGGMRNVKCVALDIVLQTAVEFERQSIKAGADEQARRLEGIRLRVAGILLAHDYAGHYFDEKPGVAA